MKNTGLMLSETKEPLKNLLDNLSGENGSYWLMALKKMLRKEKILNLPPEAVKLLTATDSQQVIKERLNGWINAFKLIPSVQKVFLCDKDEEGDLIDISVFSNIRTFHYGENDNIDYPLYVITTDLTVKRVNDTSSIMEKDNIYKKWKKDKYPDIYSFYKALIELSELYKNAVPVPMV